MSDRKLYHEGKIDRNLHFFSPFCLYTPHFHIKNLSNKLVGGCLSSLPWCDPVLHLISLFLVLNNKCAPGRTSPVGVFMSLPLKRWQFPAWLWNRGADCADVRGQASLLRYPSVFNKHFSISADHWGDNVNSSAKCIHVHFKCWGLLAIPSSFFACDMVTICISCVLFKQNPVSLVK